MLLRKLLLAKINSWDYPLRTWSILALMRQSCLLLKDHHHLSFNCKGRWGTTDNFAPWLSPLNFFTILHQLHEGQQGQVKHKGCLSRSFTISNDIKQGCILVPTLFSIFFSTMLHEAKEDLPDSIYIHFRTDGSLFNLRQLLAHTKAIEELITALLFADDCTLLAHTEKPYSTLSTASLMQPRTSTSLSAWRRLRCRTNPLNKMHTVLLTSASMAPT